MRKFNYYYCPVAGRAADNAAPPGFQPTIQLICRVDIVFFWRRLQTCVSGRRSNSAGAEVKTVPKCWSDTFSVWVVLRPADRVIQRKPRLRSDKELSQKAGDVFCQATERWSDFLRLHFSFLAVYPTNAPLKLVIFGLRKL